MGKEVKKTLIFIDGSYLYYSSKSLNLHFDFIKFYGWLIQTFGESVIYYYCSIDSSIRQQMSFLNALQKTKYIIKNYPPRKIKGITKYPSGIDIQLAMDSILCSKPHDKVVIISGDADFVPLLKTLKNLDRETVLLGFPISSSMQLRKEADVFLNLDNILSRLTLSKQIQKSSIQPIVNFEAIESFYLDKGLYFNNYVVIRRLITSAKHSIVVIDNYINEEILHLISLLNKEIEVKIITKKIESNDFLVMLKKLRSENRSVRVYKSNMFHDRFIRIDNGWWHLGHSIKDLGSGDAMLTKISNSSMIIKLQQKEIQIYESNEPLEG